MAKKKEHILYSDARMKTAEQGVYHTGDKKYYEKRYSMGDKPTHHEVDRDEMAYRIGHSRKEHVRHDSFKDLKPHEAAEKLQEHEQSHWGNGKGNKE